MSCYIKDAVGGLSNKYSKATVYKSKIHKTANLRNAENAVERNLILLFFGILLPILM